MSKKKSFSSFLSGHKKMGSTEPGAPPGTVEYTGKQKVDDVRIMLRDYDHAHVHQLEIEEIDEAQDYLDSPSNTWISVNGLHDVKKLKTIWSFFDLHPLVQEDIVNTSQRPKVESYENCIFFVLKMFSYSKEDKKLHSEQISIVLGPDYVLSFQETDTTHFKPVLDRLTMQGGRMRNHGADYLCYALIDTVVDHYFNVIEQIGDEIEDIEDRLFEDADDNLLQQVHDIRRKVVLFRKSVWPLRDALNTAVRDESELISDHTKLFLRDVYDHIIQVIDNVENYRDVVLSLHDLYMSNMSNKMNEVMKVLTIIATIFIPLTFIAGVYGMNFNPDVSPYNMPELNLVWGYPASLGIMAVIAIIMVYYFNRKGWL